MPPLQRFAGHQMRLIALVSLTVVTCGFYAPIWYIARRPFFDGLSRRSALGPTLVSSLAALAAANVLLVLAEYAEVTPTGASAGSFVVLTQAVALTGGYLSLVAAFRCRFLLEGYLSRVGRPTGFSGVATFLLQTIYLQHKINQAARLVARDRSGGEDEDEDEEGDERTARRARAR
jgi:hypothetical protein